MAGGMVRSGILFAINTTGGNKAKLKMLAVAGGIYLVARRLNNARLNAEKFADSWVRLTAEQKKLVQSMERTAQGLIDTNAEVLSVHKITEAGMTANSELMDALALVAIDRAKKMGEGAAGATTRVVALTNAITKGQTRALKEYGIELDATESLVDAQAEGMEKVIIRAKGLTASIQTLTEQTYALNNNWETFQGLFFGRASPIALLGEMNEGFDLMNDSLMDANDGSMDVMLSMDGMGLAIGSATLDMFGMAETADILSDRLDRMINQSSRLKRLSAETKAFKQEEKWIEQNPLVVLELLKQSGNDPALFNEMVAQARGIQAKEAKAAQRKAITGEGLTGKGGGAKAAPKLVGAELWQSELDAAEKSKQIAFDKNIWLIENNQEYHDKIEQQQIDTDATMVELAAANDAELREMFTVDLMQTQEEKWAVQAEQEEADRILQTEHHEWSMENDAFYREQYLIEEQKKNAADLAMAERLRDAKIGFAMQMSQGVGNLIMGLASMEKIETKRQFERQKKAAYAQTVINTAAAAVAAFRGTVQVIPGPWGIAAGIAAAGLAAALGAVQLATISKTEFEDTSGGASVGAVGSTGGGYLGGGGNFAAGGAGGTTTHNITFIVGEEEFQNVIVSTNEKASQSGKPAFATEAA